MKNLFLAIVALLAAIPIPSFGQGTSASSVHSDSSTFVSVGTVGAVPEFHARDPRYKLRKGDSFDLDFHFSPEFNQTLVVGPDGFVTLRGAGSPRVEGQTIPELTETVKAAYATILHDPVISVGLKDFDKPYFIASGELAKPGKYDLRGPLTVTEAVAIAGGFTENAKHSQVVLFRPTPNGVFEAKLLNVKKLLASRNLSEDVLLEPGDMVYVPQSAFSKFRRYIPTASMGAFYNPALF
jgi:polysaccharide export outer membrane protein